MPDEQLRLVAGLKDNASAGIRNIGKQLKSVRVEPGMAQAQKWMRGFNDDVSKFKQGAATISSVMASMGVGGLAAAAGVGTMVAKFKDLAEHTLTMKELSREIGITVDQLNAMEHAGQHFGFDPSKMEGDLKRLAGLMPIFKRGGNNELTQALARAPDLMRKIRGEANDTAAVFKDVMGYIGKLQNPQDRIKFYEQIFGDGDLEKLNADGPGGFQKQVDKYAAILPHFTEEAEKQAQALRDAVNDFNTAIESLEMKAGPTVYKWMTEGAKALEGAIDKVDKHPIEIGIGAASLGALALQRRIVGGMFARAASGGGAITAAAGELTGASTGLEKATGELLTSAGLLKEAAAELRNRTATPSGDAPGGAVKEAEDDAKKYGPGALPFFMSSLAIPAAGALAILAGGAAGGYMNSRRAGEFGEDAGTAGGDGPLKDSDLPKAQPTINFSTMWDWLTGGGAKPTAPTADPFRTPFGYDREIKARARAYQDRIPDPKSYLPADGRETRTPPDDGTHALDGFVLGSLEKPILHLSGTLKTAAAAAEDSGIKPAAFHPAGLMGPSSTDPEAMLAAGVKEGMLAAMREWAAGGSSADPSSARGGIIPASFGGGGGGGNPALGGGSFDTSGGGSTRASGSLAANQREAYAAAIAEGLSKTAARALVANLSGEGLARDAHRVHWDGKHNSGGIAQWDPARAAAIQRQFGHLPWEMSVADQTRAAIWEYRNNPRFARTKAAMAGDDPGRMIGELVSNWEDPANKGRAINQRMGYYRGFDPDAPAAGPMAGLEKVGRLASEQCVALANAAVQFRGSVTEWRKGDGADAGTLRPGTPVATFLDRRGRETDRYAGGGIGTPGAHLDHAGVFQRYITDAAGKRIGMTIAEQFKGSHGRHLHDYFFGRGWGEGNGSNYHAILGPDGKPLGGSRNPMSTLGDAADKLRAAAANQSRAARADLDAEKRRAGLTGPRSVKLDGGVEAHVHIHDGQVRSARAKSSGAVREARITVRRGPQRTFTV